MIEKVKSDKIALKPNRIILAGQQMAPYQQKLFWAALSVLEFKINDNANYGKLNDYVNNFIELSKLSRITFKFPINKIFDNYDSLKLSNSSEFKKDIENKTFDIARQIIKVRDGNSVLGINIMDYAEYRHEEEMVYVQFSKAVIPILFSMFNEGFTKIRLISFMKLRSGYSMRLYEILLCAKNFNIYKNGYVLLVSDLYFLFGVDRDKDYKEYKHFKELLLRCQKEIKEKTGLLFSFEEIKKGRKVDSIKFKNIFEDPNFDKTVKQISLFENGGISEKEIILSTNPEEKFLLDVLENPEKYIVQESEEIEINSVQAILPLVDADVVDNDMKLIKNLDKDVEQKFTFVQLEKLDKYLNGIFSENEIKSKYEFDYIEFYYNKAIDKNNKGTVKDFAGFLYKLLTEDKYKFYDLQQKEQERKERELAKKQAEKEKKLKEKQEEKNRIEKEKQESERLIGIFDSLDDESKKTYLEYLYLQNEYYKDFDLQEISIQTKFAIGKIIDTKRLQ